MVFYHKIKEADLISYALLLFVDKKCDLRLLYSSAIIYSDNCL